MDVCYPFKENFEANSNPEGSWDGFKEAIEEAKEYERTGQFIVVQPAAPEAESDSMSSEEEKPRRRKAVVKRRRIAHSSDDDVNFGESSDEDEEAPAARRGKKTTKRLKKGTPAKTKATQRPIKANKEQKLFAREIFVIMKDIEKALKNKDIDAALELLKKFDPKAITKRLDKDGLMVDAPGPYAVIEAQVLHISRLGRFVHGLSVDHKQDPKLGPYASMLYRHYLSSVKRELAIPDEVQAYMQNQGLGSTQMDVSTHEEEQKAEKTTESTQRESGDLSVHEQEPNGTPAPSNGTHSQDTSIPAPVEQSSSMDVDVTTN